MSKSFADDFMIDFDELILPQEISSRFDALERLAQNDCGETFLLAEKDGGKRFVLKCYKKSEAMSAGHEAELLRGLEHKGLPRFDAEYDNEEMLYILREYIEGVPLDEYLLENQIIKTLAVGITMELCEILSYLHSQPAPIIHRDIKPSNIIIDPHNLSVTLIDFGISRKYSDEADTDTTPFGTQKFAPPEQYGFSQTDCRADIYALGIVMRYLLTGTTDGTVADKKLARIIEKCSAFAPKDRFQSADATKKALTNYQNRTGQKAARVIALALVLCMALTAGFIVGRYTDFLHFPNAELADDGIYIFSDPMVEMAVRAALGKADNETVYRDELDAVTSLYFVGENVAASKDEYLVLNAPFWTNTPQPYGKLENLSDLAHMVNLREVCIFGQEISDLSPIASCQQLLQAEIAFCYNVMDVTPLASCARLMHVIIMRGSVSDISPLTGLLALETLNLLDIPLTDFSYFEEIKSLKRLELGQTQIHAVAELGGVYRLESLSFRNSTGFNKLDGIERFTSLTSLSLVGTGVNDFSSLNALTGLKELYISPDMEQYLSTLSRDDIEVIVTN